MSKALSMALRQTIIEHHKKGETISFLSRKFGVNRGTIRTLINREKEQGCEGLKTRYASCGKKRPNAKNFMYRAVRCMRAWHPSWGAEKIRAEIQMRRPGLKLPSLRTINRWFHWNHQMSVSLKVDLPLSENKKAISLHQIWQIDAKEEMVLADGSKNCWLNITDEHSGMVIQPPVFSQKENQSS